MARSLLSRSCFLCAVALFACSDDSGDDDEVGDTDAGTTTPASTDSDESSDSSSETSESTESTSSTTTDSSSGESSTQSTDSGIKFDQLIPDAGDSGDECGEGGGGGFVDFSYIWIANSPEGTVSKIDTTTGIEAARYRTGPEQNPDPSRTSVDPAGDVAVLNRAGSVTKFAAQVADCVDSNGTPGIQSSSGPDDVLPWGEDECMIWHVDLPDHYGQNGGARALAWDAGQLDGGPCEAEYFRLWVGWRSQDFPNPGALRLLRGDTGEQIDADVLIENWQSNFIAEGPYGAATDAEGDLWTISTEGRLYHVDAVDYSVDTYILGTDGGQVGGAADKAIYGLAIDADGNPWVSGFYSPAAAYRFDVQTGQFDDGVVTSAGVMRGLAIDSEDRAFIAVGWSINPVQACKLIAIDTLTSQVIDDDIPLPGCVTPVGVSIDIEGKVWVVDQGAQQAFVVDPDTKQVVDTVEGLVGPYTYSDMTGAGLYLVAPVG